MEGAQVAFAVFIPIVLLLSLIIGIYLYYSKESHFNCHCPPTYHMKTSLENPRVTTQFMRQRIHENTRFRSEDARARVSEWTDKKPAGLFNVCQTFGDSTLFSIH
ncbi:hypothetical protein NQZ68_022312 [Dissostichus eleginoides]|nr:hypothetical protein NQZ68_022312 [Dissostichus eleginoides]